LRSSTIRSGPTTGYLMLAFPHLHRLKPRNGFPIMDDISLLKEIDGDVVEFSGHLAAVDLPEVALHIRQAQNRKAHRVHQAIAVGAFDLE